MSEDTRTIIASVRKNSQESIQISHEIHMKTPLVSIRSFRGESFTGKGISLRPDVFAEVLPEITKAIKSLCEELVAGNIEMLGKVDKIT